MNLRERALQVTPGGAQTRSKRVTVFPPDFPQFLEKAKGAHVWDVDGRRYVDWICALGAIGLGHQYPAVDEAVREQLGKGVSFSLATPIEIETAETLQQVLPGADMVRFCKTGSEATEGAMRIARLVTGRDLIVSIGYHGWHSVHDAALPMSQGVPNAMKTLVCDAAWGSYTAFEYLEENKIKPAAVLLEAMRDAEPPAAYVSWIKQWCVKYGALLILDEMVTGFRWAIGGAGQYFSVTPDLATYGKAMANGYPLAAIVGRQDHMQHASYVSGTFGGECVSLAAAKATIEIYQRNDVIKHIWSVGLALQRGFNVLGRDQGLQMTGYPVHPRITGERRMEFISHAAKNGVLFHPSGFNVSYSHTMAEVSETLVACRKALEAMQ